MTSFATDGGYLGTNGSHSFVRTGEATAPGITAQGKLRAATERLTAFAKILDAITEQRRALELRLWRADPFDTELEADCQAWCELSTALAEFLEARR